MLDAKLNARYGAGDFPRDKFVTPPRALVIEKNSVATEHVVGFWVIPRELEPRDLTDAVRASWDERGLIPSAASRAPGRTFHSNPRNKTWTRGAVHKAPPRRNGSH